MKNTSQFLYNSHMKTLKKPSERKTPSDIKKDLIRQAGGKCANPGCPNKLIEIHHIKEWHIYHTHDKKHMIAICPSCHDQVTRGLLKIDDDTLYRWKSITRDIVYSSHIFVEPGKIARILLGSLAFESEEDIFAFDTPRGRLLNMHFINGKLILDVSINNLENKLVFEIEKNYITYVLQENIEIRERTGKFQVILTGNSKNLIPQWIKNQHMKQDSSFFSSNEYKLFDIEVLEPGLIQIQGIWILSPNLALIITDKAISFLRLGMREPISLIGEGKKTILKWTGVPNSSFFNITN